MPWVDGDFDTAANEHGTIHHEQRLSAPVSGKIIKYRAKTTTQCNGRAHETVLVIAKADDPNDRIEIRSNIRDCSETDGELDKAYRVEGGKDYDLVITSSGFSAGEQVQGVAGVFYSLF